MWGKNKILAVIIFVAVFAGCELGGKFEPPAYTIVYDANGGSGNMDRSSHVCGTAKNLSANAFTRNGGIFLGWSKTSGGTVQYADKQNVKNLTTTDGEIITLYAVWEPITAIPGANLAAKLAWLSSNAFSNTNYTIEITADESIGPQTLYYTDRTNITITLKGIGSMRTVSLSSNGSIFSVREGVTLILDNNITLQGRNSNSGYSLVSVYSGGILVMNTGSVVTGNTSSYGGVYVNGTFTMNGGTISGNTSSSSSGGGGVYVGEGTFNKTNGTIYGYSASDTVNSNTVKDSSGTVVNDRGHAVYANSSPAKRKETTAGPSVNLSYNYNNGSPVFSGAWDY